VQPLRRATKPGKLLFQVNVDSAEKNRRSFALVRFIQCQGKIEWDHHRLVAQLAQCRHERVVAKTATATHAARSRCDLNVVPARKSWGKPTAGTRRSLERTSLPRASAAGHDTDDLQPVAI